MNRIRIIYPFDMSWIIKIKNCYIAGSNETGYSVTAIRDNAKQFDTKAEAQNVKDVNHLMGSIIPL